MRQFQQSQQLSMPWTCEYGAEFASILAGQMVGTLKRDDTADMLYVKHSVLVSVERLLLENCTVVLSFSFILRYEKSRSWFGSTSIYLDAMKSNAKHTA